jgi:hypothetical protein
MIYIFAQSLADASCYARSNKLFHREWKYVMYPEQITLCDQVSELWMCGNYSCRGSFREAIAMAKQFNFEVKEIQ